MDETVPSFLTGFIRCAFRGDEALENGHKRDARGRKQDATDVAVGIVLL